MLITDRYSGFCWDYYLKNREQVTLKATLTQHVNFMKRQYGVTVKVIESDNEIGYARGRETMTLKWMKSQGIAFEPCAPNTPAQNGGAERSGGVVKEKARANRLSANLPWDMWPEVVRATVYLHNRTPNYQNEWKSPYEVFFTAIAAKSGATGKRRPNLAHLKAYGCKAFAMSDDTQLHRMKSQKLDPKAWIGYLVGYLSSNIYRIWIPSIGKTISTRDVTFDEDTTFDGKEEDLMDSLMHQTTARIAKLVREIQLPEPTHEPPEEQTFYEDEPADWPAEGSSHGGHQERCQTPTPDSTEYHDLRKAFGLPTPLDTPPPATLLTQMFNTLKLDDQPTSKTIPWKAAFMAGTQAGAMGTYNNKPIDKAALQRKLAAGLKVHRNELPKLPTSFTRLKDHPMGLQFKEAERVHLQSHQDMKSWVETAANPIRRSGQQILDCMWVYTYKLDKHNRLLKCKARLVVRGDQQRNVTSEDTYAATLASRSFRMLIAIAAKHDLELKQFDVTNAFVHATVDRDIFMRMPPGYQKPGTILRVQKALYGLRISPLL